MLSNIIGALIGREVERRRQESGIKGALVGVATVALLKRLGPIGLAVGGAYAAKKAWDNAKANRAAPNA
jgi:hypothetical protein